jgi:hypothetical protein
VTIHSTLPRVRAAMLAANSGAPECFATRRGDVHCLFRFRKRVNQTPVRVFRKRMGHKGEQRRSVGGFSLRGGMDAAHLQSA